MTRMVIRIVKTTPTGTPTAISMMLSAAVFSDTVRVVAIVTGSAVVSTAAVAVEILAVDVETLAVAVETVVVAVETVVVAVATVAFVESAVVAGSAVVSMKGPSYTKFKTI